MYSCQELGCDDAATMRVTAYMNGILIGSNTKTASFPGTWPVDTLLCSFPSGFDSVVVHYDSHPPTCQDYGVIFLADNMRVTPYNATQIINSDKFINELIVTNPVTGKTFISFSLSQTDHINITVYDITGKFIKNIFDGQLIQGKHQIEWNFNEKPMSNGMYFLTIKGESFSQSCKLMVTK